MQYRIACEPDDKVRFWNGYNWTLDYNKAKVYEKLPEVEFRYKYLNKFCYDYICVHILFRK